MKTIHADQWKSMPKNMNNKLHSLCSYMAMFPPSVPHYFIQKYSKKGDVVLDPFSGRGTTVLEACLMERKGIGNDLNPLAHVLTKAKSFVPGKQLIVKRLSRLNKEFHQNEAKWSTLDLEVEDANIRMIFSTYTLRQIVFLKNRLNWERSKVDAFIVGMLLGIVHGNSEGYLSISMPNTFSMSPNYVRGYIKKHDLKKPQRNVFTALRSKLDRCYQPCKTRGKAICCDAAHMRPVRKQSVDLIITSPPYTRVIRYGQFNWIRLWFLERNGKTVDKDLFFTTSNTKYADFMKGVLIEMRRVLKPGGRVVLVIGDVKERFRHPLKDGSYPDRKVFNLAQYVWETCAQPLGYKLDSPIITDCIRDDTKVSKIWKDKKGNATKIDRVLILRS